LQSTTGADFQPGLKCRRTATVLAAGEAAQR
jgi:hypothetical protein